MFGGVTTVGKSLLEFMDGAGINPYTSIPDLRTETDLIDRYDGSEEYLKVYLYWGYLKEYTVSHQSFIGQKEKVAADSRTKAWREDPQRSWLTHLQSHIRSQIVVTTSDIESTSTLLRRLEESLETLDLYLESVQTSIEELPVKVPVNPEPTVEDLRKASEALKEEFGIEISPNSLLDTLRKGM